MKKKQITLLLLLTSLVSCTGNTSINSQTTIPSSTSAGTEPITTEPVTTDPTTTEPSTTDPSTTEPVVEIKPEEKVTVNSADPFHDFYTNKNVSDYIINGWPSNIIKLFLKEYDADSVNIPSFDNGSRYTAVKHIVTEATNPEPNRLEILASFSDDDTKAVKTLTAINNYVSTLNDDTPIQHIGTDEGTIYLKDKDGLVEITLVAYAASETNPELLRMSIVPTAAYKTIETVFASYKPLAEGETVNAVVQKFLDEYKIPTDIPNLNYALEGTTPLVGYAIDPYQQEGISIIFPNNANSLQNAYNSINVLQEYNFSATAYDYGHVIFNSSDENVDITLDAFNNPNYLQIIVSSAKDYSNLNHDAFINKYESNTVGVDSTVINSFLNSYEGLNTYVFPNFETTNSVYYNKVVATDPGFIADNGEYIDLFVKTKNDFHAIEEYKAYRTFLTDNGFVYETGFGYYQNVDKTIRIEIDYRSFNNNQPAGLTIKITVVKTLPEPKYETFFGKLKNVRTDKVEDAFNEFMTDFGVTDLVLPTLPTDNYKFGYSPFSTTIYRYSITTVDENTTLEKLMSDIAAAFVGIGFVDKPSGSFEHIMTKEGVKVQINIGKIKSETASDPRHFVLTLRKLA